MSQKSGWKQYEQHIHNQCRIYFPTAVIKSDDKIRGRFSRAYRQIDVSIRFKTESLDVLGIIECKYFNREVNVKHVDGFIGFCEDVGASFGYLITNKGFTKSAYNRTSGGQIRLKIVPFKDLEEMDMDMDDIINTSIQSLECVESVFLLRQRQNTIFADIDNTSLEKRLLTFKEGFADLEYFALKKLLVESARVYRDFSCIGNMRVVIPSRQQKRVYIAETTKVDLERFAKISIDELRTDIKVWRDFLGDIKKPIVYEFARQFVQSEPYLPAAG